LAAFQSTSIAHKIAVTAAGCGLPLDEPTQKNHVFEQPLNHRDFEISFQYLVFFPTQSRTINLSNFQMKNIAQTPDFR